MSRLSDLIEANRTGKRFAELGRISPLCIVTQSCVELRVHELTEYKIGVFFGAAIRVDEEVRSNLPAEIGRTKRSVIEAVFGEFRPDFRELQRRLWERNYEAASRQLEKMEQRMFEV